MTSTLFLLFQSSDTTPQVPSALGAGLGLGFSLFMLVVSLLVVVGFWKVFTKAGQPGWASLIPIYNLYVLTKVAGKPGWWTILLLIPFVNVIMLIIIGLAVAERFGKGAGFGVGLGLLWPIFYPVLGFSDAQYR